MMMAMHDSIDDLDTHLRGVYLYGTHKLMIDFYLVKTIYYFHSYVTPCQ